MFNKSIHFYNVMYMTDNKQKLKFTVLIASSMSNNLHLPPAWQLHQQIGSKAWSKGSSENMPGLNLADIPFKIAEK